MSPHLNTLLNYFEFFFKAVDSFPRLNKYCGHQRLSKFLLVSCNCLTLEHNIVHILRYVNFIANVLNFKY